MSENAYNIRFTIEERARYDKLGKKYGYKTLSGLIRESLNVVIRDPTLLNPSEEKDTEKILFLLNKLLDNFESFVKVFKKNGESISRLKLMIKLLMVKNGISKDEIKEILEKDVRELEKKEEYDEIAEALFG